MHNFRNILAKMSELKQACVFLCREKAKAKRARESETCCIQGEYCFILVVVAVVVFIFRDKTIQVTKLF